MPMTEAFSPAAFKRSTVSCRWVLLMISTAPMPQLNVRDISSSLMLPCIPDKWILSTSEVKFSTYTNPKYEKHIALAKERRRKIEKKKMMKALHCDGTQQIKVYRRKLHIKLNNCLSQISNPEPQMLIFHKLKQRISFFCLKFSNWIYKAFLLSYVTLWWNATNKFKPFPPTPWNFHDSQGHTHSSQH